MALFDLSHLLLLSLRAGEALLICLLFVALHRLFVHPLAKFPGPIIHRLSGIPVLYHAWKGDLHYHLYSLHHEYGERVRYSPNKLSICNTSAANDIYGFNKNFGKPEEFYSAFRINKNAINTFNTSSKETHRRKRRIMAKAFSESALISYEVFIADQVADFMAKIHKEYSARSGEFDFAYEFNCLMLDIMGGLCFGEAFGFVAGRGNELLKQAHLRTFRIYIVSLTTQVPDSHGSSLKQTAHEPLLKRLYLDRLMFPGLLRASNILGNYARKCTFERIAKYRTGQGTLADDKGYSDIMSHLLESGDEETGTNYSDSELLGEGVLMMMAGSDTSSSSLTATLFYLARHPKALTKVRLELHQRFSSAADIQPRNAETCTYLRACMDESMRLSPPAPTNIPRVVGPGGASIDGDYFPEGTYVGVPNFALFRKSEYFSGGLDPHAFVPERWIVGAAVETKQSGVRLEVCPENVKLAQSAFLPFSMGPRHCIGKHLAMKEVSFILASILYEFEVQAVGTSGVLDSTILPGTHYGMGHVTMEHTDVYTSVEHGVMLRLKLSKSA